MDHFNPLLRRFFWALLLSIIAAVGIAALLLLATGAPPPALLSILPVVLASLDAGREFKRRTGSVIAGRDAWILVIAFFAINFGLSLFVFTGGLWSAGMIDMLAPSGLSALLLPFAIFCFVWFGTIRAALWLGGRLG